MALQDIRIDKKLAVMSLVVAIALFSFTGSARAPAPEEIPNLPQREEVELEAQPITCSDVKPLVLKAESIQETVRSHLMDCADKYECTIVDSIITHLDTFQMAAAMWYQENCSDI
ncbi:MAG: hypothetical protein ACXABY_03175 [Candidatus Thorarchaeota archaeon]